MIRKIILIITLLVFSTGLVFTSSSKEARAACSYTNQTLVQDNKYNVSKTDKFRVTINMSRSGDLATCEKAVRVALLLQSGSGTTPVYARQTIAYRGQTAKADFDIVAGNINQAYYATPNSLKIGIYVFAEQTVNAGGGVTQVQDGARLTNSGWLTVNVTGGTTTSGSLTGNITFKQGNGQDAKSVYNKGETIQAHLNVNPGSVNALDSSIQNFYIVAKSAKKTLKELTVDRARIATGNVYFSGIPIDDESFQNGANPVTIEVWQAGTELKLMTATGSINVAGLSGASNTGGDTPPLPTGGGGTGGGGTGGGGTGGGGGAGGGGTPTAETPVIGTIQSPIGIGSVGEFIVTLIQYMLGLVAALAVLFIIIGGIRMVTSGGSSSSIEAGKKTATWAIIGLVASLLAFTIVNVVQTLLKVNA